MDNKTTLYGYVSNSGPEENVIKNDLNSSSRSVSNGDYQEMNVPLLQNSEQMLSGTISLEDNMQMGETISCNGREEYSSINNSLLDKIQLGLDVAGFIPAFGAVPDILNGIIFLCRGDFINMGLSFVAAIPLYGDAIAAASKSIKYTSKLKKIDKFGLRNSKGIVLWSEKGAGKIADKYAIENGLIKLEHTNPAKELERRLENAKIEYIQKRRNSLGNKNFSQLSNNNKRRLKKKFEEDFWYDVAKPEWIKLSGEFVDEAIKLHSQGSTINFHVFVNTARKMRRVKYLNGKKKVTHHYAYNYGKPLDPEGYGDLSRRQYSVLGSTEHKKLKNNKIPFSLHKEKIW